MPRYGIALDLGTSGIRGQAIDLESKEILSTVITSRHPLPGANIMDQMNFAIEAGQDITHDIHISAVNQVISALGVPLESCERLAVCGNPIQLSFFEEIEIRDLAYAGENKKRILVFGLPTGTRRASRPKRSGTSRGPPSLYCLYSARSAS